MTPDAARVVGAQMDRVGRLSGGRAQTVDVVSRQEQDVEITWTQPAPLDKLEPPSCSL